MNATPALPKKSKRIVELDALRALAAINLLLFHFTYVYQNKYGFSTPLGVSYPYGKYGVQLFFMLSGLVNAMTLLSKRRAADFLAARIIRIGPPFWTAMLINAVLVLVLPLATHPYSAGQWLANLTIMPNLFGYECIEPVTWTLQIELLFYGVILGLFVGGALSHPLRITGLLLSIVVAVDVPLRLGWMPETATGYPIFTALRTLLILDNLPLFLMGLLINEIRCGRGRAYWNWLGVLICGIVFHAVDTRDYNPAATLLLTGVLAFSAFGRLPLLRLKPFVFLSSISYSLYLLHNNLGSTLIYHLDPWVGPWGALTFTTILVFGIAACSTHYFELPLAGRMRARWQIWSASFSAWRAGQQGSSRSHSPQESLATESSTR